MNRLSAKYLSIPQALWFCIAMVCFGLGTTMVFQILINQILNNSVPAMANAESLPDNFRQILPRGAIRAIVRPKFVPANQAHIAANAWVIGVELNGQAKAYSINMLNRHEVVNDRSGKTAFATVW